MDEYDAILSLSYDPVENAFYDDCGFRIINILEVIAPNDIFLFRKDHERNLIVDREYPRILYEITIDQ